MLLLFFVTQGYQFSAEI